MIRTLLVSLALTLVCELAAAFIAGVRCRADLAVVALANVVTNPAAVFALLLTLLYVPRLLTPFTVLLECAAVLIEWRIYKKALHTYRISPFLLSLLLNGISFAAGRVYGMVS